jgi:hypothetical protein
VVGYEIGVTVSGEFSYDLAREVVKPHAVGCPKFEPRDIFIKFGGTRTAYVGIGFRMVEYRRAVIRLPEQNAVSCATILVRHVNLRR